MIHNFSAGPAALPDAVVQGLRDDLHGLEDSGIPLLGLSHRDPRFLKQMTQAEQLLRRLLAIPDTFAVLLFPFGATAHFSAVPLNFAGLPDREGGAGRVASVRYHLSGYWSEKAASEAGRYAPVERVAAPFLWPGADGTAAAAAAATPAVVQAPAATAYAHYCPNETIDGIAWPAPPESVGVPLLADASSCLLAGPVDWSRHAGVYASAQKNLGVAGLSVLLVRRDLLGCALPPTPAVFDYAAVAASASLPNTANVFAVRALVRMLAWCEEQGGVDEMARRARQRSALLYSFLDASRLYYSPVPRAVRSMLNVPFRLRRPELTAPCLTAAASAGLQQLAGHRSRGGMRASMYNAMSMEAVERLCDFLSEFEHLHV